MKIKSKISKIKSALKLLSPIIDSNHSVLSFRYLLVRYKNEMIEFKAFNDSAIASSFLECSVEAKEEDCFFVLADHFLRLVNSFKSGDIQIYTKDDNCYIKKDKSKYSLKLLDKEVAWEVLKPIDIDYYKNVDMGKSSFLVNDFAFCYSSVSHCLSKNSAQRELQNIFLTGEKLVACDGIQGAITPFHLDNLSYISLDKRLCDCILQLEKGGTVTLYVDKGVLYGKSDLFYFVSSVEEDYPFDSIEPILDKFDENSSFDKEISLNPADFLEALDRVLIFVNDITKAVRIRLDDLKLKIDIDSSCVAEETVEVLKNKNWDEKSLITFDGKILRTILSRFPSEVDWVCHNSNDVQYFSDGFLLQFIMGLSV